MFFVKERILLRLDSINPIQVKCDGRIDYPETVQVQTPYVIFTVKPLTLAERKRETWYHITTRPAFEVGVLSGQGESLQIVLQRKKLFEADNPKMKCPGGYYPDDVTEESKHQKVQNDTGIKLRSEIRCGNVIGHRQITTPIELFYSFDWSFVSQPKEGIAVESISLKEAAQLAINGEVDNDSTFSLIMRLFWMQQNGLI